MRDYDTRWNISRDFDDARSDNLPTGLGLALFDFDHTLPRKYGTGLQAALGLLEECTTPRCDSYKGGNPSLGAAKLMQAFIASPGTQDDVCELADTCHKQMARCCLTNTVDLILLHCVTLLQETVSPENVTTERVRQWLDLYHNHICIQFLLHKNNPVLRKKSPKITSKLLAYGLRYQDLEWFSRGTILRAILKGHKKLDKGMSPELLARATRYANRLIALAPDNPASFEMMSYVLMQTKDALPDAATYMGKAVSTARQNGDDVGILQYTFQCMYYKLWMHSMKQNSAANRASLEQEVCPLVMDAQAAETQSGLRVGIADGDHLQEASAGWQGIAETRIKYAKLRLKRLAFSMPTEMPEDLLDYLEPYLPPSLKALSKQIHATTHQDVDPPHTAVSGNNAPATAGRHVSSTATARVPLVPSATPTVAAQVPAVPSADSTAPAQTPSVPSVQSTTPAELQAILFIMQEQVKSLELKLECLQSKRQQLESGSVPKSCQYHPKTSASTTNSKTANDAVIGNPNLPPVSDFTSVAETDSGNSSDNSCNSTSSRSNTVRTANPKGKNPLRLTPAMPPVSTDSTTAPATSIMHCLAPLLFTQPSPVQPTSAMLPTTSPAAPAAAALAEAPAARLTAQAHAAAPTVAAKGSESKPPFAAALAAKLSKASTPIEQTKVPRAPATSVTAVALLTQISSAHALAGHTATASKHQASVSAAPAAAPTGASSASVQTDTSKASSAPDAIAKAAADLLKEATLQTLAAYTDKATLKGAPVAEILDTFEVSAQAGTLQASAASVLPAEQSSSTSLLAAPAAGAGAPNVPPGAAERDTPKLLPAFDAATVAKEAEGLSNTLTPAAQVATPGTCKAASDRAKPLKAVNLPFRPPSASIASSATAAAAPAQPLSASTAAARTPFPKTANASLDTAAAAAAKAKSSDVPRGAAQAPTPMTATPTPFAAALAAKWSRTSSSTAAGKHV